MASFEFVAELWLYGGQASWHFVTLPNEVADDIEDLNPDKGGFGSVRVEATVGTSTWKTSLFPDKQAASFVLPVKKSVRVAEDIHDGQLISVKVSPIP